MLRGERCKALADLALADSVFPTPLPEAAGGADGMGTVYVL